MIQKRMKIIIVDDCRTFREGVKYYLENIIDHQVIGMYKDGVEFLQLEYMSDADFILMDIEMPNLDGFETAKRALWKDNTLKIIAVTSYTDKAYIDDLICAGFRSVIFKDTFYDEFETMLSNILKNDLQFPDKLECREKWNIDL